MEMCEIAFRDLIRKKIRSFLTALGVIFGIASVVSMMAIGEGAQNQILNQIKGMGLSNIVIKSVEPKQKKEQGGSHSWIQNYGLTHKDTLCLSQTVSTIEQYTVLKNRSGRAWNLSSKIPVELKGVQGNFFDMLKVKLSKGRYLSKSDHDDFASVCIVPSSLLRKLSLPHDTGQSIRISEALYVVVGIYSDSELPSSLVSDYGSTVFVPFTVSYFKRGLLDVRVSQGSFEAVRQEVSQVICKIRHEEDVEMSAEWIEKILTKNHPQQDFSMEVPLQLLRQKQQTQKIFNSVMVLIAAISLIVGGIGIINIMLATVSERTREIGIRRAIGATKADIVVQFLTETVMLTVFAGIAGCILGIVIISLIESSTGWDAVVQPQLFMWAFGISCIVGVAFGIYPARKAAELDPIESLRYE